MRAHHLNQAHHNPVTKVHVLTPPVHLTPVQALTTNIGMITQPAYLMPASQASVKLIPAVRHQPAVQKLIVRQNVKPITVQLVNVLHTIVKPIYKPELIPVIYQVTAAVRAGQLFNPVKIHTMLVVV